MKGYIVIIGILAVIVLSLIALNVSFQRTLQIEMAEQFNKQQLLLANAEASNMQAYLGGTEREMLHMAQMVSRFQILTEDDFELLTNIVFKGIRNIKKRIDFFDRQGKVLFARGDLVIEGPGGKDFIGKAETSCPGGLLIKQDTKRVYLIAPICRPGSLIDTVVISFDIQDMAKSFLGPLKSGSRGYAWMMDEKGDLLYHPTQPDMVGRNLYKTDSSCFKCHKTFDVEKKIIEGRGDNFGRYVAPTGEDKVLAFSTASVGDSKWIVAVSAPYTEVTMSIKKSMKYYSLLIIAIFLIMSVGSVLLIFFYRDKARAEELEKHEKELEKYAGELEQKVSQRTGELTAEKEKLNTIVSAIGIGIMLVDNQELILWINQTMKDIAGRDITGTHCREIFKDYSIISSSEENGMQTAVLSNLFGKSDRCFQVTTAPVKADDGGVHGYIKLIQDVTELKRQEEQMMHSEKLACLGRLTSGIAYEIGNPLTSVFSFIQILKNMEKDEFKKETIETIYFHMKSIADILTQLSVFSKMPLMELRPSKVNSLIEDSLSLIQYDKRTQDITIIKDLATDMPMITTDESQLSHVLVNMVLNAADAMPDGGTLTIRSRTKNNSIVIDFEDTGVGIDSDNLSRVFDPLFTTKEKGTGLGLAVSYRIIKKLNGSITVESEPDKGSKFVITLPVYLTI